MIICCVAQMKTLLYLLLKQSEEICQVVHKEKIIVDIFRVGTY